MCPGVMSRLQLGCISITNTESTPEVKSSECYPGIAHKTVHSAPVSQVFWYTAQEGWLLSVHVKHLFSYPPLQI